MSLSMGEQLCTKCFDDDDCYRESLGLTRARLEGTASL